MHFFTVCAEQSREFVQVKRAMFDLLTLVPTHHIFVEFFVMFGLNPLKVSKLHQKTPESVVTFQIKDVALSLSLKSSFKSNSSWSRSFSPGAGLDVLLVPDALLDVVVSDHHSVCYSLFWVEVCWEPWDPFSQLRL